MRVSVTGEHVFEIILDANATIEKRCHRFLAKHGLTLPQYRLMMATATGKARTLRDLADDLICTRGNLTGVVDRLERDGWLVRKRDADDRRVVILEMTPKGARIHEVHRALVNHLNILARMWTPEEQRTLVQLLPRLGEAHAGQADAL